MSVEDIVGSVKDLILSLFKKKDKSDDQKNKKLKSPTREMGEAVIIALVLAIIIRAFVVEPFKIPTGSMKDTLIEGDHLMVNKMSYGFQMPSPAIIQVMGVKMPFFETQLKTWWSAIERGDVVVFRAPEDRYTNYIKRVIGLPGETIEVRDKVVYINGEPLEDEPYKVFKGPKYGPSTIQNGRIMAPFTVPEGHVFCMGDNRDYSYDSRFWGPVPIADIKGRAFMLYFSRDPERTFPRGMKFDRFFDLIR